MPTTVTFTDSPAARRSAVRRSLWWRAITVVVLVVFVCFVGDYRRRHIAMSQMERYASALGAQIGTSGVVPLNVNPDDLLGADDQPIDMETLSRDQVRCLRAKNQPILIAWSVCLTQVLGRNGRATVSYESGQAVPAWVTEDRFIERRKEQAALLEACK
jgi:hypothetical protein